MAELIQDSVSTINSTLQQGSVPMIPMGTMGDRVRKRRQELGLSQPELAQASGLATSTISELEQNRSKGSTAAHRIANALGVRVEWLTDEDGPMLATKIAESEISYGPDVIMIPHLDLAASMGPGESTPHDVEVVHSVRVNLPRLRREVAFSTPANLRIITGYGDSMEPTFRDGDPLLVDTGVNDIKVDAVYVMERNEELFIKRLQRRPDGTLLMISDNKNYPPYEIADTERVKFRIRGRVLMAWNGKRL